MNINELSDFIDYKPVTEKEADNLVTEIKDEASKFLSKENLSLIEKAYDFARKAHGDQPRLSGEPYFTHPLFATKFLLQIKPGIVSIQACILHDVIEDTEYTYDDIKKEFGEEVAFLCQWLEKVGRVRYKWEQRNLETLKKTFLTMGEDLRVIFIKLADRIHNVQTLKFHPQKEKRERIATETLKVFVPVAQRLGLSVFQTYLENWAFYNLNPTEFNRIFNYIRKRYWQIDNNYIEDWKAEIENLLEKNWIKYHEVKWRLKSPYRIYKKLEKYWTKDIGKIMDILAFRIVTENTSLCYSILGIINNQYTPLIKKIKDYIAVPKENWYKSLHTTIIGMFKFPVEIQIRTKEMDYFADYWIAAHYAYKEAWDSQPISERQAKWIERLQEVVKEFQNSWENENFKNTLHTEVLEKNIFVYTPNWDIIELPRRSTVLDFAFKIHSEIWLKFKNWFVNQKIVPIDYKLQTWDIVEINKYKNKYTASRSWLSFLHNPSSKAKLNRYLKQVELDQYLRKWEEILNNKLKEFSLPLIWTKNDRISQKYKWKDYENLMIRLNDKQLSPSSFIKSMYSDQLKSHQKEKITEPSKEELQSEHTGWITNKKSKATIIVDQDKTLDYTVCAECLPNYGEKIIARMWKEWIKIHNTDCKALTSLSYDKLLEAHWQWEDPNKYILRMKLKALDQPWTLIQVLFVFSDYWVNISSINIEKQESEESLVNVDLEFENPWKMDFIIKELKNKYKLVKIISKNII